MMTSVHGGGYPVAILALLSLRCMFVLPFATVLCKMNKNSSFWFTCYKFSSLFYFTEHLLP